MLKALKAFLETTFEGAFQESSNTPEEESSLLPTAAAMLLLEVAWADHDMGADEISLIKSAVQELFELPAPLVNQLVEDSRSRHADSVGVYEHTRTLNTKLDQEEKYALLVQLWRIALSDSELHALEEHVIRRISELLYVAHPRFIAAKQEARSLTQKESAKKSSAD